MGKHNPHGQSQDKDRHNKKRHDENKNRNHNDYKDPVGSKSSILPPKNSGYDEKQPSSK